MKKPIIKDNFYDITSFLFPSHLVFKLEGARGEIIFGRRTLFFRKCTSPVDRV